MSDIFVPQADGSTYQWLNCTCASDAMWLYRAAGVKTTGAAIRRLTGDTSGGTTLAQMDEVNTNHFGMPCVPLYGVDIDVLWDMIRAGRGAIIQYSYAPLLGTRWASSRVFSGGHSSYIPDVASVTGTLGDPLAHGYQAGVPLSLLREACGELVIGTRNGQPVHLGDGRVYAMLTPLDPKPSYPPAKVTTTAPDHDGDNAMVTYSQVAETLSRMFLAKGQPLYASTSTGSAIVTRMNRAGYVKHLGSAGTGWRAVQASTRAPYGDRVPRPTILYVPKAAGTVVK
jgi:hypothetical protein